jgi:tripeptidyl-peptidase-1
MGWPMPNNAGYDSGGGFSYYSSMPAYQKKAVQAYLNSGVTLPSTEYGWNSTNRGYPDVAAVGEHFCVLAKGRYARDDYSNVN